MLGKFKIYIQAALLVIIGVLITYSMYLNAGIKSIKSQNESLVFIAKQKESAAKQCSDSVDLLVNSEKTKTKAAQDALAEAKKEADSWRVKANTTIYKKPKVIDVTKVNMSEYGGSDSMTALKDYLATHQLMNEDIDERDAK